MSNRNVRYGFQLLQEARQVKKYDLIKAIRLFEEAIPINRKILGCNYYQLANCYHSTGKREKSYQILFKYLEYLKSRKFYMLKLHDISDIYYRICVLLYKDERYEDYIYYYSLMKHSGISSLYSRGMFDDYKRSKREGNLNDMFLSLKVSTCFRRIGKLNIYNEFSDKFNTFFDDNKSIYLKILKISYEKSLGKFIEFGKRMEHFNPSLQESLLNKDEEFLNLLESVSEQKFIHFYKNNLSNLLD